MLHILLTPSDCFILLVTARDWKVEVFASDLCFNTTTDVVILMTVFVPLCVSRSLEVHMMYTFAATCHPGG